MEPTDSAVHILLAGESGRDAQLQVYTSPACNVGGRPKGSIKCSRCRKKRRSCGPDCVNWRMICGSVFGTGPAATQAALPTVAAATPAPKESLASTLADMSTAVVVPGSAAASHPAFGTRCQDKFRTCVVRACGHCLPHTCAHLNQVSCNVAGLCSRVGDDALRACSPP